MTVEYDPQQYLIELNDTLRNDGGLQIFYYEFVAGL
jgi:hypothetical protein